VAKPMRYIYKNLVRFTINARFTLEENHMRDLFHAISATRCAGMVTLDAHWAEQVRKLKLPSDSGKVYSQGRLDEFLADLEMYA
jgi:hypothetical protein